MRRYWKETAVLTVTALIAIGSLNFLASRHYIRADLTHERQYSLARSTKAMLKDLDDLVTIRVYFTRQLPSPLLPLKQAVDDLLAEYQSYAGNGLQIEYPDPQASPQIEQQVQMMGIQPVELNVVAKDKREVARVYLGIAIMHADKLHVIPVIDRPDNLEYELSAGLLRVTKEHQPTIGWWGPTASGGEVAESGAGQYETVHRQLEQRYTVRTITHDGASVSTKELQALLLVAPKNFTAAQAGAVERYLAEGGKVVALVDRMAVDPRTLTATAVTSGLESLFAKYGVTLNADLVADASSAYAAFGGGTMTIYRSYPFWPVLHRQNLDASHPIVARLEQLTFPWVSSLTLADPLPEGLTATALVRSSKQSGLTTEEPPFRVDPDTGMGLLPAMPSPERPLAVVVSGALSGGTSGQLLVVGTSRIIEDRTARQFVDGVIFFENAVDYVALGEQLIGIRSRQVTARPIAPLSDTGRAAIKYLNTFGVPIMVIVAGLLGLVWRRARRRALRIAYNLPS